MFKVGTAHRAGRGEQVQTKQPLRITWLLSILLVIAGLTLWLTLAHLSARAEPPCPCSVFTASQPASAPSLFSQSGTGIELGMKVVPSQDGYISGIRFYKVAGMAGTHTASLWDTYRNRIAQAVFTSESAAGWQEVDFAPIAVTANTLYTASVFMADGNYTATSHFFGTPTINYPLTAPQDNTPLAQDGQGHNNQGVFDASGSSVYPDSNFNSTNYWIDVVYIGSTNSQPPSVTATSPTNGATTALVTDTITATFDKLLDSGTVSTDTVTMKDPQGGSISGSVSYNATTNTIKFAPDSVLSPSTTYTMTLKGGSGTALADTDGHKLGADYSWSFTTTSATINCPCDLKHNQAPGTSSDSYRENYPNGLELGLKIVPTTGGYITAIRFYKPLISTQSTHTGNVWDGSNGNLLSTATFSNESSYGWQEAKLSSPLPVVKDGVYIISFGTTIANYQAGAGTFIAPMTSTGFTAYPAGDSHNTAFGSGVANSVFSSTIGTYPNQPGNQDDYFVDAVFSLQPTQAEPLHVTNFQPSDKSYGVMHDATVSASFDQALDASTVNSSTVQVKKNGASVAGTVSYDANNHQINFIPSSTFSYGATYTVNLSTGITDIRGLALPQAQTWSFTIGSQLNTNMQQGNGGPIVVFTNSTDPYSTYYTEILRTEGMPYFDVKDIATLNATTLASYTTAIVSQSSLTDSQVSDVTAWVKNGGSLVAMRPDKKLAPLLGLADSSGTLTNSYLLPNIATPAGLGIVDTPIQYKGTADTYALNGATATATLYSDNTTSTQYPAATSRAVGSGTAMSFTYDLARSVIALHQGNQAWAGQDRDGDTTIRTNDLFYGPMAGAGNSQPDWLDSTKMDIPQADEQQRLLANMITEGMKNHLPAPRFWYLPDNQKAALVLAGDDHGLINQNGTEQVMTDYLNDSATNCSIMDWQCLRATNYTYPASDLTDARAFQFTQYGFEIGDHPSDQDSCRNPTASELSDAFGTAIAAWRAKYVSEPHQQTSRFHCYMWTNWDMMPLTDLAYGIHYDLDTVAYPASWVGTHSPIVNGSGMNMRLTDANGALIDVYQGVTNFDNTSSSATNIADTFDNAIGSDGYYGIFGSHYDMNGDNFNKTLISVANSRNVPIISSLQALQWLNGRNSSNFTNLTITQAGGTKVSFDIQAAEGAHGLRAMMPTQDTYGTITGIESAGQPVSYQTAIIKGVSYAQFDARPGSYVVSYSGSTPVETATTNPLALTSHTATTTPSSSQLADVAQPTATPSQTVGHGGLNDQNNSDVTQKAASDAGANWWHAPALWVGGSVIVVAGSGWLIAGGLRRRQKNDEL